MKKMDGFVYVALLAMVVVGIVKYVQAKYSTANAGVPLAVNGYNPTAICPMPVPKAVDDSINNPLGIKYFGDFIKESSEDSEITAKDGGTFAEFTTPEAGIDAGKHLLRSKTGIYGGKTVDWSMRKWSNQGYGADEVLKKIPPETHVSIGAADIVNDLDDEKIDALLAAMTKREKVGPMATAVPYANPNDHRLDQIGEFTVEVSHGCFSSNGEWVMPPKHWAWWTEEIVSDDQDAQVALWFFGRSHPQGPFSNSNFPRDYRSNQWRLQAMGKGTIKVRYVYTATR